MAKWFVSILTKEGWQLTDKDGYATKREANVIADQAKKSGCDTMIERMNNTSRETYSRIIGYNFGTDADGNDCIYNGAYWAPETGKKQYEFLYYDRSGNLAGQYLTDYKGFREIIDKYDWPKK